MRVSQDFIVTETRQSITSCVFLLAVLTLTCVGLCRKNSVAQLPVAPKTRPMVDSSVAWSRALPFAHIARAQHIVCATTHVNVAHVNKNHLCERAAYGRVQYVATTQPNKRNFHWETRTEESTVRTLHVGSSLA